MEVGRPLKKGDHNDTHVYFSIEGIGLRERSQQTVYAGGAHTLDIDPDVSGAVPVGRDARDHKREGSVVSESSYGAMYAPQQSSDPQSVGIPAITMNRCASCRSPHGQKARERVAAC